LNSCTFLRSLYSKFKQYWGKSFFSILSLLDTFSFIFPQKNKTIQCGLIGRCGGIKKLRKKELNDDGDGTITVAYGSIVC